LDVRDVVPCRSVGSEFWVGRDRGAKAALFAHLDAEKLGIQKRLLISVAKYYDFDKEKAE
jgi:hypothetical protein